MNITIATETNCATRSKGGAGSPTGPTLHHHSLLLLPPHVPRCRAGWGVRRARELLTITPLTKNKNAAHVRSGGRWPVRQPNDFVERKKIWHFNEWLPSFFTKEISRRTHRWWAGPWLPTSETVVACYFIVVVKAIYESIRACFFY